MWLLLALALDAQAEPIEAWARSDFGERQEMVGYDGWVGGYDADPWWGEGSRAYSATDHNTGDSSGERYGSGWAADNWVVRGEAVGQGAGMALLYNEDDDTIGVVACASGGDSFYLFGHSANSAPPPMEVNGPTGYLLKVDNGVAEVLGFDRVELRREDWSQLEVSIDDGHIEFVLNGRDVVIVDDPDPLPPGQWGFYAYDAGNDGGYNSTEAFFDYIEVHWYDNDDDGEPDDSDNCEHTANPDQDDHDGDGIGNACDEDWPPDDTDVPDDTDDTDHSDRPPLDDDVTVGLDCGCTSSGAALPWVLVLLAPLGLRRRR